MQDIRIAVVQMNSRVGDTGGNISTMERFLSAAAAAGVDILCFPELSINGYNAGDTSRPVAESIGGASVQALVELGKRFGLTFMAGLLERDIGGIVYNTQVVFDAQGVVGSYRKNHVPTTENGTWSQGSEMPVFAHEKARYGIEICYDSHFPELSTILAERGADVIVHDRKEAIAVPKFCFFRMLRAWGKARRTKRRAGCATCRRGPMTTASTWRCATPWAIPARAFASPAYRLFAMPAAKWWPKRPAAPRKRWW